VRKSVTLPVSYVRQLATLGLGIFPMMRLLLENAYTATVSLGSARPVREPYRRPAGHFSPNGVDSRRGYAAWLPTSLDNLRRPADPFG
jgi:hypothetical protein